MKTMTICSSPQPSQCLPLPHQRHQLRSKQPARPPRSRPSWTMLMKTTTMRTTSKLSLLPQFRKGCSLPRHLCPHLSQPPCPPLLLSKLLQSRRPQCRLHLPLVLPAATDRQWVPPVAPLALNLLACKILHKRSSLLLPKKRGGINRLLSLRQ